MLALLALCASGVSLILALHAPVYDYTWLEAPSSVVFSAVALTVLVRIAAFPPRDGVLFEKRIAVSLAAGVALAIQLVQWCPWPPVHQNRGFLTLALWLLVPVGVTLENRHKERVDRGAPTPERF